MVSLKVWCETGWTMTLENYTGNIVDDALFSEHADEMKGTASFYATWLSVRNVWQAGWEIAREQWRDRACSTTPTDRENRNLQRGEKDGRFDWNWMIGLLDGQGGKVKPLLSRLKLKCEMSGESTAPWHSHCPTLTIPHYRDRQKGVAVC